MRKPNKVGQGLSACASMLFNSYKQAKKLKPFSFPLIFIANKQNENRRKKEKEKRKSLWEVSGEVTRYKIMSLGVMVFPPKHKSL